MFEKIREVLDKVDKEETAQIMAEVVTDDGVSTYDVFESLADAYISGTEDMRAGIDKTLSLLTGYYMPELAEYIIRREGE